MSSSTAAGAAPAEDRSGDALVKALSAVRMLRGRLDALEQKRHEPIAIVGMGCRLPGGVRSPGDFWQMISSGTDAITGVPGDRWDADAYYDPDPNAAGRTTMRFGGFIDGVDRFDPYFFGISPREAARMDPQQRHFLEVAWEALEDAGLPREKLQGSATGVFVGANATDYLQMQLEDPAGLDTYTVVGGTNCIISNRLSYQLDLRGPSMTVDTACSSSLVAVHLACQSLRTQECSTAVAAGMNLILSPTMTVAHSKGLPLAPDGRCKTFDAKADGYTRGEGVGVLVLKRLSDAVADGDRIWAVIRGSAVNQDGLTNGLTAPSGLSQRDVIKAALRSARLEPSQVTLLEAHGTGTSLGDPIEVEALHEVYGTADAGGGSCTLGSVKTNIGHLEAGAGLAGLIKVALSIHHRAIAPNLHLEEVNPHISLKGGRLRIPTEAAGWDEPAERRHGAVSSFGAGGTNAHVVLGPAPQDEGVQEAVAPGVPQAAQGPWLLPVYAGTADALVPMARAWRDHLQDPQTRQEPFSALVHGAATRRTRHAHRLAVAASTHAEAAERLDMWLADKSPASVITGRTGGDIADKVVFVFPGQGAQRAGMGRELMRVCPVFKAAVTECDEAFKRWTDGGFSVIETIMGLEDGAPLERIDVIQPALFAIAVGLAARARAFGVEPDAVVGHSMGEVAAAYVAGVLSLDDAARVICRRSFLLRRISGQGAMLVVGLPFDQAAEFVADHSDRVSVAVSNSPTSTVLSGDPEVLAELAKALEARNVFSRHVKVDVASHSPQVDALREDLLAELEGIEPRAGKVPVLSTVTGELCDGSGFDAEYWAGNLREPVLFWDAVGRLIDSDHGVFVEMSPHPTLLSAVEQAFEHTGREGLALPSMRRDEPEAHGLLEILAALHTHGLPARLTELLPAAPARPVPLPAYAWQHESFWFRASGAAGPVPAVALAGGAMPEPDTAEGRERLPRLVAAVAAAEPGDARAELVRGEVAAAVAGTLELSPDRVDRTAGFFQMGMDSTLARDARIRLETLLGRRLPATVMFEHPSVEALSAHLLALAERAAADAGPQSSADPSAAPSAAPIPTAIPTPALQVPSDLFGSGDDTSLDDLSEAELLAVLAAESGSPTHAAGGAR
ncbi:acyltransferase domain-containing protein [Streptomyces sp. NBC_00047]|uniref:type I polyketide synthase n=1 Tax=Streptomyces sp. NBC_00047 TaxID=2975627 RepID=UPI00225525EE|nr:beta-ketoacyl synthase N-terminal-like domain-containing protein [Streptomyces sp. NBC_00047]MCX5612884.1 acyltransferase domain-containing protein [Streptomyces sp. NBC_00047]